jgi:hypothetical protein
LAASSTRDAQSDEKFFEESAKILNQYLANKLNLSPQSLTLNLIEARLEGKGIDSSVIQKIAQCYETCDQIRFGKLALEGLDRKLMTERIREIIYAMERK